jgi:multidrug resistance efflux pump
LVIDEKMADKKPEIKYSEPVREIMGNPPGRILKWGTTVIFSLFILFILFAWLFRYPDLIPSPVEITTENPPVTLASKITGRIKHLFVSNKGIVKNGQLLAVMETAASIDAIERLRQFTDTVSNISSLTSQSVPVMSDLGEMEVYFGTFIKNLSDFNNFTKNDYYGNKIKSGNEELKGLRSYLARLKENERLYSENLDLEINKFTRDSVLKSEKAIAQSDYERSRQALLRQRMDLQQVRLEIASKNIEITGKKQLLEEYAINKKEELEKLSSSLDESFRNLKAQVRIWETNYLLISPIGGTVTFTKFWSENQSVNKDEPVLAIVPDNQGKYIGRIYLKMQRSGKVKPGQDVNIKLSSFPYLEYGMVRGKVKSKSLVPSVDAYVIEIELPDGLTTLYNRPLDFTQNMQGVAEIITDDMSLLQKIVNPFHYLLSRNKR